TIQEGCDKFCKFCVVPYTRGPEYSRSSLEIISEARQLIKNGSKEIILLGQNVNAYNFKNQRFSDLLYSLSKIENLERIRYTTSHPKDLTDDLIEIHGECKKLMPLLHLPVQSGSNTILKNMNRDHTIEEYLEIIEKLRKKNSSMKFSSDFIIAYPGETKEDFEKTVLLMKKVEFINSYSFIFNARPGTPAANLKKISEKIAKQRLAIFQRVADQVKTKYRKELVNSTVSVLFENNARDPNKYFGRDEYFNSVIVNSNENLAGQIRNVKIDKCNHNTLFGEVILEGKPKEYAA
ncbi:MAG: MiaB/RimO family radical SAM methylthiotransferase, partial [Candidatus Pelagibacter sp. TMED153]